MCIRDRGKAELAKMKGTVENETKKQLELLAYYCDLAERKKLAASLRNLATGAQ